MEHIEEIFMPKQKFEVVDVTPAMAAELLEKSNRENRPIRANTVRRYAEVMRAGEWQFSPEAISMSKTGRLLNGQHRMSAVALSGVPCRFLFAYGFDDGVFEVLDRGIGRTASDALRLPKKLVECASVVLRIENYANRTSVIVDHRIKKVAELISDASAELLDYCNTSAQVFSSAPFRLACIAHMMSDGDGGEYAKTFYRNLVLGKFDQLPLIGSMAVRAVLAGRFTGSGNAKQVMNASVAWDIFDHASADKSKLYITYKKHNCDKILKAIGYSGEAQ